MSAWLQAVQDPAQLDVIPQNSSKWEHKCRLQTKEYEFQQLRCKTEPACTCTPPSMPSKAQPRLSKFSSICRPKASSGWICAGRQSASRRQESGRGWWQTLNTSGSCMPAREPGRSWRGSWARC